MGMTSMERVLTALAHKEPDRVPLFLLLSLYGAKELDMSIKKYFSSSENVIKAQVHMQEKYKNDCLYTFYYAGIEVEAFDGEVIFYDDGPPNAGEPIIKSVNDIMKLENPKIGDKSCLVKVLETIGSLKKIKGDEVPIIGVVMSPFSLPVMQMGFDKYLDLMYEQPEIFWKLMSINEEFCVSWANEQLKAGATAICCFDPVSSTSIIPREMYLKTGFEIAKRTIARIHGPTATHMASGRSDNIIQDIAATGTAAVGVSSMEDIGELKRKCAKKLSLIGNLNGIEMCRWSVKDAESAVRKILNEAGDGGGLIISDNHGEIPFQVEESTLLAISEAVNCWGKYPLKRMDEE